MIKYLDPNSEEQKIFGKYQYKPLSQDLLSMIYYTLATGTPEQREALAEAAESLNKPLEDIRAIVASSFRRSTPNQSNDPTTDHQTQP